MEFYKSKYSDKKSNRSSKRENEPTRSFRNSRDDRSSRYSRDDSRTESTTVTCSDCGDECQVPFVPRTNKPVYCGDCFREHKPDDSGSSRYSRDDRSSRYSRDDSRTESTTVTCSDCGDECQVPFVPRTNKPVYCGDCFREHKPDDSGSSRYSRDDRSSRYSRDDRSSRSSYGRESNRNNSKSRKPRNDKFLKKQEIFYSNGSDKFYETVKEKLYEILGGKTCSSCGFKDERALGISPISDNTSSNNRRGGDTSSWGKYISAPELAREELRVFCLNCNEIREPISKHTNDRPKSKKSKCFPR